MSQTPDPKPSSDADDFARQAGEEAPGFLAEFFDFLKHERKWWMLPLLVALLLLGLIILASSTAIAPFIYTLF